MQLHVLASGCPQPLPDWYGSAFILDMGSDAVLIDCGPATTYRMARMGISMGRIGHVFFTHHHFDHNADFPCFALTRWDFSTGAEPPLKVYGPPPTERFVDRLLGEEGAFVDDWKSRIDHPVSQEIHRRRKGVLPRPAPAIEAKDVGPGKVAESDSWTATAARVRHVEPTLESLVYRFDTEQGSVLFAGDCADCPELRALAKGVDTLVLACALLGRSEQNVPILDVITGSTEAAEIAQDTGVGRIILTHVSPTFARPGARERAIAEVARSYDGAIVFPDELTTVPLTE